MSTSTIWEMAEIGRKQIPSSDADRLANRLNEPGLILSEVVARVTVKDTPAELVVGGCLLKQR